MTDGVSNGYLVICSGIRAVFKLVSKTTTKTKEITIANQNGGRHQR